MNNLTCNIIMISLIGLYTYWSWNDIIAARFFLVFFGIMILLLLNIGIYFNLKYNYAKGEVSE